MSNKNIRNKKSDIDIIEYHTILSTKDKHDSLSNIYFDDNYLYIKTQRGWKRVSLIEF